MSGPEAVVLDASVLAKWYLPAEEWGAEALALRSAVIEDRLGAVLPDHARFEVANAITVACRRGRVAPADAQAAISDFLEWDFTFIDSDDLILQAFTLAQQFGCALYDGLYLALAQSYGLDLITADAALLRKVGSARPWVKWIGDYEIA